MHRSALLPWGAFLGCCLVWGSTWAAIKVGYDGVDPFTGAALRFYIAAALLFIALLVFRIPLPRTRREWGLSGFMGVLLFGTNYGLVYWSEQYITSGLTSVLFSTLPLWTLVLASTTGLERFTLRKITGVVLGIGGVAVLFSDQLHAAGVPLVAPAAVVVGATCAGAVSVAVKRYGRALNPVALNAPAMLAGAIVLTGVARLAGEDLTLPATPVAWGSVLYLAVVGSIITFLLYTWLLKRWDASQASFISVLTPLIALLLGAFALGEAVTLRILVGTALVIAGVLVVLVRRTPRASP